MRKTIDWAWEALGQITGSPRQLNSLLQQIQIAPTSIALLRKFHDAVKSASNGQGSKVTDKHIALSAETLFKEALKGPSLKTACHLMRKIYNISFLDRHGRQVALLSGSLAIAGVTIAGTLYSLRTPVQIEPLSKEITAQNNIIIKILNTVNKITALPGKYIGRVVYAFTTYIVRHRVLNAVIHRTSDNPSPDDYLNLPDHVYKIAFLWTLTDASYRLSSFEFW